MATTALYRKTSNEVVKISLSGQTFSDRDTVYWGVLTDPTLTDGNQAVDASGNLRVLGTAKFAVVGSNTIRNATAPEIAAFATGQTTDESAQDASEAVAFFQTHPRFRKAFKAVCQLVIDELNILRGKVIGVQTSVWDAASITNGTGLTSPNITVAGAAFGDTVSVGCSITIASLTMTGYVSAANTVNIRLENQTGSAINLASATYTVVVRRDTVLADRTKAQAIAALIADVSAND